MSDEKHARWLIRYPLGKDSDAEYMCSNCHSGTFGESNNRDTCKHCGAIMDISAEYVDIDDVISAINKTCDKQLYGNQIRDTFINAVKSINVTTERYGYWIVDHQYRDSEGFICAIYRCSICDGKVDEETTFCPHCGNPMKKGK